MAKRTTEEIKKDFPRILAYLTQTPNATTQEIAIALNLSVFQVNKSLKTRPRLGYKLMLQLEKNDLEAENKSKKTATDTSARKKAHSLPATNGSTCSSLKNSEGGYVIDASITGLPNLRQTLSKIMATSSPIILTSITIKELEKMQAFNDTQGNDARFILNLAVNNEKKFRTVLINETVGIPDDCIIKYCADNNKKVVLLTSDKTMALKARMYNVTVTYFQQQTLHPTKSTQTSNQTLYPAQKIGKDLLIKDFHTVSRDICVISKNNVKYDFGPYKLNIGDHVYIATKKEAYITFADYEIISTNASSNCTLVDSKRIYPFTNLNDLKNDYKNFIKEFKLRHDA